MFKIEKIATYQSSMSKATKIVKVKRLSRWTKVTTTVVVEYTFTGFPRSLAEIICGYCSKYRLRKWIDPKDLDDETIWANPRALGYLHFDPDDTSDVDWFNFSMNPHPLAFKALEHACDSDDVDTDLLVFNTHPDAMKLIHRLGLNRDSILNGKYAYRNPSDEAYNIFFKSGKIPKNAWPFVFANSNPRIVKILEEKVSLGEKQVDWLYLSGNSSQWAIDILKQDTDRIFYTEFAENQHPWAIAYLKENRHRIFWREFSRNPNIFKLKEEPGLLECLSE
jgi:hypothetical protein